MSNNSNIEFVKTAKAAMPQGHYSQALIHNGIVYVAMQIAIHPERGPISGSISEQAEIALENVKQILIASGSGIEKVLRVTVYVSDIAHWGEVDKKYREFFGDHKPARGVVPVGKLHLDLDVAFEVTAAV